MVVNPEDRSSRIEAQTISMRQFHFPQIDIFSCRATISMFKRDEHRGHVLLQFIPLRIYKSLAQDFSVPTTFIRL